MLRRAAVALCAAAALSGCATGGCVAGSSSERSAGDSPPRPGRRRLARQGLDYADNPYDRARYERLAELVERAYTDLTGLAAETVSERFRLDLGAPTAKVGTTAVVPDGNGRVLLQRRADDGRWGLPGGWLDPASCPRRASSGRSPRRRPIAFVVTQMPQTVFLSPSVCTGSTSWRR